MKSTVEHHIRYGEDGFAGISFTDNNRSRQDVAERLASVTLAAASIGGLGGDAALRITEIDGNKAAITVAMKDAAQPATFAALSAAIARHVRA